MSEAVKKVKVKDVAKDLNISFNDVVAFLNKKGYKQVKNLMSSVDDDMMRDINARGLRKNQWNRNLTSFSRRLPSGMRVVLIF